MVRVSEEELGALEQKIQREIRKIFSEFQHDRAQRESEAGNAASPQEKRAPVQRDAKNVPAGKNRRVSPQTGKKPRQRLDTERILYGTHPPGKKPGKSVIEEDMHKILRPRNRKKSG